MRVDQCWCRRSSPIIFLGKQDIYTLVWECLSCHGTITVHLNYGEEWKERSCND